MDRRHLTEMKQLEEDYWWHVGKRRLAAELLKKYAPSSGLVVEGGIGSGRNLVEWQNLGYDVHGFDVLEDSITMAKDRGIANVELHDLQTPWPLEPASVSAVVMLDVLEHVEFPVRVLEHIGKILRPDGIVVLTVPAYQWLFGRWDQILGHHRRYTRGRLRKEVQSAGFDVAWSQHWNSFTLPPAIVLRLKEKLFGSGDAAEFPRVPRWVNSMLLGCATVERNWLLRLGLPLGLSVAAVLRPGSQWTSSHEAKDSLSQPLEV